MIKPTITSTQSKAARAALGVSQSKVASATGINRSQFALFEVKKYLLDDAKLKALRTYYEDLGYEFDGNAKGIEDVSRSAATVAAQSLQEDVKVVDRFLVPAGLEEEALESLLAEIDLTDQEIVELAKQPAKFDWLGDPDLRASQEMLRLMALNYARVRQLQFGQNQMQKPLNTVKPNKATVRDLAESMLGLQISQLVES